MSAKQPLANQGKMALAALEHKADNYQSHVGIDFKALCTSQEGQRRETFI